MLKRKKCSVFQALKKKTSKHPYLSDALKSPEREGFAAAGFVLCKREDGEVHLLLERELRECGGLLKFLGGKRHHFTDKSPIEVATKKINEETGYFLHRETLRDMNNSTQLVYWDARSKYVLYFYELTSQDEMAIDVQCTGLESEGVKRLEWTSLRDLQTERFLCAEVHEYARVAVRDLRLKGILARISDVFDLAKRTTRITEEQEDYTKMIDKVKPDIRDYSGEEETRAPTIADLLNEMNIERESTRPATRPSYHIRRGSRRSTSHW